MRYVTRDGVEIEVGRVDRRLLDAINIPAPVPPTRSVEAWGGIVEQVPVLDDPGYLREKHRRNVKIWRDSLAVIALALKFTLSEEQEADIAALAAMGIGEGGNADYLHYGVSQYDQARIVDEVYYQSTVTARGIVEAETKLNYTWRGKPLSSWSVGYNHGRRGSLGVDIRAAMRSGLTWGQFCELPGPEQSTLVTFWMLEDNLSWLSNQPLR